MKSMFRVCATERLFVPDMFPAMDRAIYVDTDLIFLRWISRSLWSFLEMTSPIYKVEYYETQLQDLERNLRFMTTLLVCHHLSRIMLYIMNESG